MYRLLDEPDSPTGAKGLSRSSRRPRLEYEYLWHPRAQLRRARRSPACLPTPCASRARCRTGTTPAIPRTGRRQPRVPPPCRPACSGPCRSRRRTEPAGWRAAPCAPLGAPRRSCAPGAMDAGARTPRSACRTRREPAGGRCRRCGSRGRPLLGARAVQRVVPAAIGRSGVIRAPTTKAARNDAADRAQLHP